MRFQVIVKILEQVKRDLCSMSEGVAAGANDGKQERKMACRK